MVNSGSIFIIINNSPRSTNGDQRSQQTAPFPGMNEDREIHLQNGYGSKGAFAYSSCATKYGPNLMES